MRKTVFLWLLLVFIPFLQTGCVSSSHVSKYGEWKQENGKMKVLSTIAMIDDLVKTVGGENVDTIPLIQGDLDPHSYELIKGDDEKFARADVIFYNGLGLEHGMSLRRQLENNGKAVAVSHALLLQHPSKLLHVGGQTDPHIWMDIALWVHAVEPIILTLSEKDPAHADDYRKRGEELKTKMEEADAKAFAILQTVPASKRYLVTSHDAFRYFTRHYLAMPEEISIGNWEIRCAAPEGLAPDAQLSVTDLQNIIAHIVKYKVNVLFPEANVNKDSLRKIVSAASEKGIKVRLCNDALYGDSMGVQGYLQMISHNVEIIAHELNQGNDEENSRP